MHGSEDSRGNGVAPLTITPSGLVREVVCHILTPWALQGGGPTKQELRAPPGHLAASVLSPAGKMEPLLVELIGSDQQARRGCCHTGRVGAGHRGLLGLLC